MGSSESVATEKVEEVETDAAQDPEQIAEGLIAENGVVVFAKSYCGFCRRTRMQLDRLKVKYALYEMDIEAQGPSVQAYLKEKTGQRTVPNIFIQQKHIGGNSDLERLLNSGKLYDLFDEAGVSHVKL